MIITKSFDLSNYQPWAGAIETMETIIDAGKLSEFGFIISELYEEIDETKLNDILWFDSDRVLESLWLSNDDNDDE